MMTHEITDGTIDTYVVTFDGTTGERGINYERIARASRYEHIPEARLLAIAAESTEDLTMAELVAAAEGTPWGTPWHGLTSL